MPIPVAARAKVWVYGYSFARTATSNPAGRVCCVFVSSGVCEGANNRPEESYQVSCLQGD